MEGKGLVGLVLSASAVLFCYAVVIVGLIAVKLSATLYVGASPSDFRLLVPGVTQVATAHSWVFAVVLVSVCPFATAICHVRGHPLRCVVVGLGCQSLVFWTAMFCDCYAAFLGGISMHHGSSFEIGEFVSFGFGVFPISLAAIVLPVFATLLPTDRRRSLTSSM